ncbi:MAG: PDZ domain-containing protein [Gemmatimonadaceae bacterium]
MLVPPVVVTDVESNSPADRAGIRVGDIVLSINGVDVSHATTPKASAPLVVGSHQVLELQRGDSVFHRTLTAIARPKRAP